MSSLQDKHFLILQRRTSFMLSSRPRWSPDWGTQKSRGHITACSECSYLTCSTQWQNITPPPTIIHHHFPSVESLVTFGLLLVTHDAPSGPIPESTDLGLFCILNTSLGASGKHSFQGGRPHPNHQRPAQYLCGLICLRRPVLADDAPVLVHRFCISIFRCYWL